MANPVQHVPSRQNLRNTMGLAREFGFAEFNTTDMVVWDDDFLGDTLHGGYQTTAASGTALAIAAGANGIATQVTEASNDAHANFTLGLDWQGQLMCAMAARVKIDAITDVKMEIGFTDVVSGTDAAACNDLDGATFHATDCAVWAFDTDDTTDNWKLAATYDQGTNDTVTDAGFAPVADTYETLIVALEGTRTAGTTDAWTSPATVHFYRLDKNGYQTYRSVPVTTGPTSNTLITPHLNVTTRNGTANTMTVDFLKVWQRRTAD